MVLLLSCDLKVRGSIFPIELPAPLLFLFPSTIYKITCLVCTPKERVIDLPYYPVGKLAYRPSSLFMTSLNLINFYFHAKKNESTVRQIHLLEANMMQSTRWNRNFDSDTRWFSRIRRNWKRKNLRLFWNCLNISVCPPRGSTTHIHAENNRIYTKFLT